MKCLVFLDHDIICRHFVLSGALAPLAAATEVKFIFPDDGGKRLKLDPATLPLAAPFERIAVDQRRQQYWRWLLFADQIALRFGRQEAAIRRLRRKLVGWKAALLFTIAGLPGLRQLFNAVVNRRLAAAPNEALDALIAREKPDVVLHPTVLDGPFVNDLIASCSQRGIPLVYAMNSWDNPSTKRSTVGKPNRLLVWGPQTRAHAVRFVGMPEGDVVSFGAAQFDAFAGPPRIDRTTFATHNDFDPSFKVVLFAGSNSMTDEFATLASLDEAVSSGRLPGVSIIYRPHPWGLGGRGGDRLANATWRNVRVHAPMRDYVRKLAEGSETILLPDYRDTHDLLCNVDVVVSPLSTILIEAMLHGKPVAVFTPESPKGSDLLSVTMLPMLHFDEFLALPEVARVSSVSELELIIHRLIDPATAPSSARLTKAAEYFVTPFERPWRDRIVDFLQAIARET